jgi:hypothetical protein
MSETAISKTGRTGSNEFSINGLLIGYLVFGLFFIGAAITMASFQTVQVKAREMFEIGRGALLVMGFLIGLVITTPFALHFEKNSRD